MNRVSAAPFSHILRQHVVDASFLWSQWSWMSQHYSIDRYATHNLERRLRANLSALMLDQTASHEMAKEAVELYGDPGEFFVAGWLALQNAEDDQYFETLVTSARDAVAADGIFAALSWLEPRFIEQQLPTWANSENTTSHLLAVEGCRAIKFDPGTRLNAWLESPDPDVRATAIVLAGEQGAQHQLGLIRELSLDTDPDVKLSAQRCLVLLGERGDAVGDLVTHAVQHPDDAEMSASLAFFATAAEDRRNFIRDLWQQGLQWQAARLAGLVQGPDVDSWLLKQMQSPELIVPAGLSFVDRYQLEPEATELFTLDLEDLPEDIASQLSDTPEDPYPIHDRITLWLEDKAKVQEREPFHSNRLRMFSFVQSALESAVAPLVRWDLPEIPVL